MIDHDMIACWQVNYGLDTRTPADAMRYWDERCNGMAPAGAVAALGLCIEHIERLRTELAEARRDAERYRWLREAQNDDMGVAQGFGTVDVGSTGVADTYERILYRANLDAAIDAARAGGGK